MAQPDADGGNENGSDDPRTVVERHGRYDEIEIEGVESRSVTIDYGTSPPEVMVHATDWRIIREDYPDAPSHISQLPEDDRKGDQGALAGVEK